jgi:hypothetical protein
MIFKTISIFNIHKCKMFYHTRAGHVSGDNSVRSVRDSSVRCFTIGDGDMFQGTMVSDL